MTEYDCSPDAMDKYKKKQASVGKWITETQKHEHANPFKPLPEEQSRVSEFGDERHPNYWLTQQSPSSVASVHAYHPTGPGPMPNPTGFSTSPRQERFPYGSLPPRPQSMNLAPPSLSTHLPHIYTSPNNYPIPQSTNNNISPVYPNSPHFLSPHYQSPLSRYPTPQHSPHHTSSHSHMRSDQHRSRRSRSRSESSGSRSHSRDHRHPHSSARRSGSSSHRRSHDSRHGFTSHPTSPSPYPSVVSPTSGWSGNSSSSSHAYHGATGPSTPLTAPDDRKQCDTMFGRLGSKIGLGLKSKTKD